jgi:hypothetical protein
LEYGLVLFHSVQGAIRAERILMAAGLRPKLIPVPRHLSSQCGVALRFEWGVCQELQTSLEAAGVEWDRIVKL